MFRRQAISISATRSLEVFRGFSQALQVTVECEIGQLPITSHYINGRPYVIQILQLIQRRNILKRPTELY